MIYIYILELCNNKFYIGKLYNIYDLEDTILMLDETVEWLYYNKIIKIISIECFEEDFDEKFFIYEFIQYYGINNVRGDSFYKMRLTLDIAYNIFANIKIEYNKCYLCGSNYHNGYKCKLKNKYNYDLIVNLIMSNIVCFNCNMKGHYKEDCRKNNASCIILSV
jgi:hypothetical protein